jgi:hypothetical protein
MRTPRLPAVDWTDAPADLNGLVRFVERQNLISARVPSHFKRSLPQLRCTIQEARQGGASDTAGINDVRAEHEGTVGAAGYRRLQPVWSSVRNSDERVGRCSSNILSAANKNHVLLCYTHTHTCSLCCRFTSAYSYWHNYVTENHSRPIMPGLTHKRLDRETVDHPHLSQPKVRSGVW